VKPKKKGAESAVPQKKKLINRGATAGCQKQKPETEAKIWRTQPQRAEQKISSTDRKGGGKIRNRRKNRETLAEKDQHAGEDGKEIA